MCIGAAIILLGSTAFALPPSPEIKPVDVFAITLSDSPSISINPMAIASVDAITVGKVAGDIIYASEWNSNFSNIKAWIDAVPGSIASVDILDNSILSADIYTGTIATTDLANDSVHESKYSYYATDDAISEDGATYGALRWGSGGETEITMTITSGETLTMWVDVSCTITGPVGSGSNFIDIKVMRDTSNQVQNTKYFAIPVDGTNLSAGGVNCHLMVFDTTAGTNKYSLWAKGKLTDTGGNLDKDAVVSVFLIDKSK